VVALGSCQTEEPLFEDRVLTVPQDKGKTESLLLVGETGQPVLTRTVGAGLLKDCNVQNSVGIQAPQRAQQRFVTQACLSSHDYSWFDFIDIFCNPFSLSYRGKSNAKSTMIYN
jgi:hypothetical protein